MRRYYSKDIKTYDLKDGYTIEKVSGKEFSVHFAIYTIFSTNIWFRQSFEKACSVIEDCEICYWVKKDGKRIGGVLLEPNYMNCLVLEPPYDEYNLLVAMLKNLLIDWSLNHKAIVVGGVKPDKINYYENAGFKPGVSRRCMIRPTEKFEVVWKENFALLDVSRENMVELISLFEQAYSKSSPDRTISRTNIEKDLEYYFENFEDSHILREASSLIYDTQKKVLVGACLISIWEQWPNVYDIVVNPAYQGQGLATQMLKKSLSVLKSEYPVLRLFVTLGNEAEKVYHKLGFLAGLETTEMTLEV